MSYYDRQIFRIKNLLNISDEAKEFLIDLIGELKLLFCSGRFNVFPSHDYSSMVLRWDKAYDFSSVKEFSEGLNDYVEIVVDPNSRKIMDFRVSLSGLNR